MCLLRAGFLGVVIAVVLRPPVHAQSFDFRHQRDLSSNPGDLHFRLATADGVTTFHRGERIPLTLEFWSDSPDKYKLSGATYDRSGRLPTEEFVLDRNDVVDPYADYFSTRVLGGLAGGLRSYPVLDAKPYKIEVNLNDWFRFDQPGTYRLYLKSHRLSRERNPGETGDRVVQFAAVSNVLELAIVADDAAWTESKLRSIESVLVQPEPEMPKPGGPPVPVNLLEDQLRSARQELRYMGTPAAVALAFQDARKLGTSPDTLLLIGASRPGRNGRRVRPLPGRPNNPHTRMGHPVASALHIHSEGSAQALADVPVAVASGLGYAEGLGRSSSKTEAIH